MELTTEMVYAAAPFAKTLEIECEETSPDSVRVRLTNRVELSTIGGSMHGGALMSLSDLSAAICAGLNVPAGFFATTAESTTYFLKPLHGSVAIATARPVRVGKSIICVEIDIHSEKGDHCARTSQMLVVEALNGSVPDIPDPRAEPA